jgi:hypothetical protein
MRFIGVGFYVGICEALVNEGIYQNSIPHLISSDDQNPILLRCLLELCMFFMFSGFHHLSHFSDRLNRSVRRYLIYLGDEYRTIDNVTLLPVAALFRGE